MVCSFANIHGFPLGILANNGVSSWHLSSHFSGPLFRHCQQSRTLYSNMWQARYTIVVPPKHHWVTLPSVAFLIWSRFMVGSVQEKEGIIKHGSKLINAVSNASVPSITVIIGASYGAGNYAMMGTRHILQGLTTPRQGLRAKILVFVAKL